MQKKTFIIFFPPSPTFLFLIFFSSSFSFSPFHFHKSITHHSLFWMWLASAVIRAQCWIRGEKKNGGGEGWGSGVFSESTLILCFTRAEYVLTDSVLFWVTLLWSACSPTAADTKDGDSSAALSSKMQQDCNAFFFFFFCYDDMGPAAVNTDA